MNNKRLLSIANFIDNDDKLIDVGCDHGYLGIYLVKNNLIKDILLTDISKNALQSAIDNINKYNLKIDTLVTDGLNNINLNKYNVVSISGMGATTILNILKVLDGNKTINKLIIQSNNDLDKIRNDISNMGYYLDDEITLQENSIYYVICKFLKGTKELSNDEIKYGLIKNDKIDYYNYLLETNNNILNKIPSKNTNEIKRIKKEIDVLNQLLEKCR